MVDIDIAYEGGLHCVAVHGPSGAKIASDAPVDNHGKGESFSPTDLVATALGTCMLTVMGIRSKKEGWTLEGAQVHVRKGMTTTGPRRIARLEVKVTFPAAAPKGAREREILEHTANTCPVRLSILEAIEVPTEFVWG